MLNTLNLLNTIHNEIGIDNEVFIFSKKPNMLSIRVYWADKLLGGCEMSFYKNEMESIIQHREPLDARQNDLIDRFISFALKQKAERR